MNIKSIFISLYVITIGLTMLISCSSKGEESGDDTNGPNDGNENALEAGSPQFQVSEDFQHQLANVFTSYVSLKDAFVSSNPEKVKSEAAITSQAVSKVDMNLLSGAAQNDWKVYLPSINNSLKGISESFDLEEQRKQFSTLSENLYKLIKAFGLGGKEAFYDYCPMAFDNTGAYWLSDEKKIRNPYFGDKMLSCGEVKEKLR